MSDFASVENHPASDAEPSTPCEPDASEFPAESELDPTLPVSEPEDFSFDDCRPLLLETTGITKHLDGQKLSPGELWKLGTVHKHTVAAKLREAGDFERSAILDECHSRQVFCECQGCRKVRIFRNRCDNLWCPECAASIARRRLAGLAWWTAELRQPKHVVLTLVNIPVITPEALRNAKACLRKLRHRKFCDNWQAGMWSLEITQKGKGWHLHFHLLVEAKWIDQTELSRQWRSITADQSYIVHVQDCRGQDYLNEVAKYVCKGSELASWEPHEIKAFCDALESQRTFGVFGELYGKRTEWKEFLDACKKERSKCDCGSNHFRYFDENEFHAHFLDRTASSPNAPPSSMHIEVEQELPITFSFDPRTSAFAR